MKIFGIGTDIVNIKRIEQSLKKHNLLLKIKFSQKKKFLTVKREKIQVLFMQKDLPQKKHLVKL